MMAAQAPVIMVTGASSGFGALAARALGEAGHFLHAGRPADAATATAYRQGPYSGFEDRLNSGLASLAPDDEDAGDVARAIVDVVAAGRGRRPFRVHVNTEPDGAEVVNAVADRVRSEFLRRAGLGDLIGLPASNPKESRS